jgi:hypothetical protein
MWVFDQWFIIVMLDADISLAAARDCVGHARVGCVAALVCVLVLVSCGETGRAPAAGDQYGCDAGGCLGPSEPGPQGALLGELLQARV